MRKVILSDIGNVVVGFDNYKLCRAIARYCNYNELGISRIIFQGPNRLTYKYTRGLISTFEFREMVLYRFGCLGAISYDEFDEAFAKVFVPNQDVVRLWQKLGQAGVVITAVSDLEELRHEELERIGIMSLFNHSVLSYKERTAKPYKKMYQLALERSGVEPAQAVYIDDILEYVEAAQRLGIESHHYQNFAGLVEFLQSQGFDV